MQKHIGGLVIKQTENKIKLRETSKAKQNSYFSSVKHKTRMPKLTCIGGSDATRLLKGYNKRK